MKKENIVIVEIKGGLVIKTRSNFKGFVFVRNHDLASTGDKTGLVLYEINGKQLKSCERELKRWL